MNTTQKKKQLQNDRNQNDVSKYSEKLKFSTKDKNSNKLDQISQNKSISQKYQYDIAIKSKFNKILKSSSLKIMQFKILSNQDEKLKFLQQQPIFETFYDYSQEKDQQSLKYYINILMEQIQQLIQSKINDNIKFDQEICHSQIKNVVNQYENSFLVSSNFADEIKIIKQLGSQIQEIMNTSDLNQVHIQEKIMQQNQHILDFLISKNWDESSENVKPDISLKENNNNANSDKKIIKNFDMIDDQKYLKRQLESARNEISNISSKLLVNQLAHQQNFDQYYKQLNDLKAYNEKLQNDLTFSEINFSKVNSELRQNLNQSNERIQMLIDEKQQLQKKVENQTFQIKEINIEQQKRDNVIKEQKLNIENLNKQLFSEEQKCLSLQDTLQIIQKDKQQLINEQEAIKHQQFLKKNEEIINQTPQASDQQMFKGMILLTQKYRYKQLNANVNQLMEKFLEEINREFFPKSNKILQQESRESPLVQIQTPQQFRESYLHTQQAEESFLIQEQNLNETLQNQNQNSKNTEILNNKKQKYFDVKLDLSKFEFLQNDDQLLSQSHLIQSSLLSNSYLGIQQTNQKQVDFNSFGHQIYQ